MPFIHPRLLQIGFVISLLASIAIMTATVVYVFLLMQRLPATAGNNEQILSHFAHTGTLFCACGFLVGVAIALLGVAMLLAGIQGDMDAEGKSEKLSLKFARLSPGALFIVCATIIISFCVHGRPRLDLQHQNVGVMPPPFTLVPQ